MPRHVDRRILPYAPDKLFTLVADIERYPEFLPWCLGAIIRERRKNVLTADLIVGARSFSGTFTSLVTLEKPGRIAVAYAGGPLKHLSNEWTFTPHKEGCALTFFVDFAFRSSLLSGMMNPFFDKAFYKMAETFEKRAEKLYS